MKKSLKMPEISLETRLKIEQFFIEELWQLLLVVAFIFGCAWLFDKYVEAVMFAISHIIIRQNFNKQYHCGTTALCLITTLTIAFFGILTTLPISISILSTIPICFLISWVGYVAQDRVDCRILNVKLQGELDSALSRIKELECIDLYKMSETELRQYGACLGLSDIQQDILVHRVIDNLKISEICELRCYGRTTIKYHIKEIKQKLNIEKV